MKKGRQGEGGGRPIYQRTDETAKKVESMAGFGVPQEDIASFFDIHFQTLTKYYAKELRQGKIIANMAVGRSLYQKAVSDTHSQAVTAAIWWSKTQMGWKETVHLAGDPDSPLHLVTHIVRQVVDSKA